MKIEEIVPMKPLSVADAEAEALKRIPPPRAA